MIPIESMFPLIFLGTAWKKTSVSVFTNFGENLGAQNFFAYRFKKAQLHLYIFKQNGATIFLLIGYYV